MSERAVMLFPRRVVNAERERLWEHTQRWWDECLPDIERFAGEHLAEEGPFNRSAAINRAAVHAGDWDVAVITDGDVLLDGAQVMAAIKNARDTGRATLAFDRYCALNPMLTQEVLRGFAGSWERGVMEQMRDHVSSCVVVPRRLWQEVMGFDERFEGWGFEDQAFISACRVLGGGIDRVPGTVWHLHHRKSIERDPRTKEHRASSWLVRRYYNAVTPAQMGEVIADRFDSTLLVIMTDGRRDCLTKTLGSFEEYVKGEIGRTIISDDSGDPEYQAWLRVMMGHWELDPDDLLCSGQRIGYARAMQRAWDAALSMGHEFVFWLEDDFLFNRTVDLAAMADVLRKSPHLVQMALRRQAWFKPELEAGGIIERHPDAYEDVNEHGQSWLEHRQFFTCNPSLIPRSTLARGQWPTRPGSEAAVGQALFRDPALRSAYWGSRDDPPWVHHIGERQGIGY